MKVVKLLVGVVIVLAAIQFVPYGRDHKNPPVTGEPKWDSPGTHELYNRACKDCHSNDGSGTKNRRWSTCWYT